MKRVKGNRGKALDETTPPPSPPLSLPTTLHVKLTLRAESATNPGSDSCPCAATGSWRTPFPN